MGLDTIRLRGRLASVPSYEAFPRLTLDTYRAVITLTRPLARVGRLTVSHWLEHDSATATFELCLPRFIYLTNRRSLTAHEALDVITAVHQEIGQGSLIDWAVGPMELDLMRIDTTRHFAPVSDPDVLLDGLRVVCGSGPKVTAYTSRDGITSLRAGRQDWTARLYDKRREMEANATKPHSKEMLHEFDLARNVLRFEAVARRPLLRRRGLHQVRDLTTENLMALNRWVFERAKFHTEVGGVSKLKAAAVIAMGQGPKEYRDFAKAFALLHLEALGYDPPQTSPTTLKRLRRVAKQYGLTSADFHALDRPSLRLDYASGRLLDGQS